MSVRVGSCRLYLSLPQVLGAISVLLEIQPYGRKTQCSSSYSVQPLCITLLDVYFSKSWLA